MSSVESLREFVIDRLRAAADEIFRVFKQTVIEYEEEIDRQRKLLDIVYKPEVKLHRIELPQQHVCKEEEVLADQQLCNQERNSSLDQEEPEPPQIKEEEEDELCTSQEGEHLELKQETIYELPQQRVCKEEEELADQQLCNQERNSSLDQEDPEPPHIKEEEEDELCTSQEGEQLELKQEEEVTSTYEESDHSEDPTLYLNSAAEKESVVNIRTESSVPPEPKSDLQPLSSNCHVAESEDQKGDEHEEPGSTRNAESKHNDQQHKSKSHINNVYNPTMSKIDDYTGKKSFKCDTCGKDFKYKSSLQAHLRIHTGENLYPCGTCGKTFIQKSLLNVHTRIHTGEKPYLCKTCGKSFRLLSVLKVHIRTHTGEKPYLCNTCGKAFSRSYELSSHTRSHTGERPLSCKTCGRDFRYNGNLTAHIRRAHTGEKPYLCKMCGKKFVTASHLASHKKIA